MRAVRLLVALVLAVLLQLLGSRSFEAFNLLVDPFLVVTVIFALKGDLVAGMLGGLVAGLTADGLSGGPFGLYGFADTIVGYGTALAARRLVIQRATSVLAVGTVAALAQQVVVVGLTWVLLEGAPTSGPIWPLLKILVTGVSTAIAFLLWKRLQARFGSWRESRGSRLRFGR
jgi:rod shape-determining protein MreD